MRIVSPSDPNSELEQAVRIAMVHRYRLDQRRSESLPHCFWASGWLAAVFVEPTNFPHGLSKVQRDELVRESFQEREYHPILLMAVRRTPEGNLYVAKEKVLPDFDARSRNQIGKCEI